MDDCEATTSAVTDDFDVFLSYHAPDSGATLASHLHEALELAGFRPVEDAPALMKGNLALNSIDQVLQVAKVHVAIISKGYAESQYRLNELVAMMRSCKPVIPVFYDVEPVDLRWLDREGGPNFAAAFERHKPQKHKSKGKGKKVHEWTEALLKLSEITGFRWDDYKRDEEKLKWDLVDAVTRLAPSNQPVDIEHYRVGLNGPTNECIQVLEKSGAGKGVLGLVGMGGIGKTTLAREIYNHFAGQKMFRNMTFLDICRPSSSNVQVRPTWSRKLREQLLWDLLRVRDNYANYGSCFRKLSTQGPVFIVIDNIQDAQEFNELIPDISSLGQGSRIVFTSRDHSVLNMIAGGTNFDLYVFQVPTLDPSDSHKLFNLYAFRDEKAPKDFQDLARVVGDTCHGLPLAVKVMGASLFDKKSDEDRETVWPGAIEALRHSSDVMGALKWSYDILPEVEKFMFVDITCLFYGWHAKEALEFWKSCKNCSLCCHVKTPYTSLRNLVNKNLVNQHDFKRGYFSVHDLLRDLGQEIGRLNWSHFGGSNAEEIVTWNHGTNKMRALNLKESQMQNFEVKNFANMPNLHFLILPDGCSVTGDFIHMSKELRWLQWKSMPLAHVPTELNLSNMTVLDFSYSTDLASLWTESNVSLEGCPNLLKLNLEACTSIMKLPNSIGKSSHLQSLYLQNCKALQKLPKSIGQLKALKEFYLIGCSSLKALPDTISDLSNLVTLNLEDCISITKLPETIGLESSRLLYLSLNNCKALQKLPDSIGKIKTLGYLGLTDCTNLEALPDTIGNLSNLFHLMLDGCNSLSKIPTSIGLLSSLEKLDIGGNIKCQTFSKGINESWTSLEELILCNSGGLEMFLDYGAFKNLYRLDIGGSTITKLPESIYHLTPLKILRLSNCDKLTRLPRILGGLSSLEILWIEKCSINRLPKSIGLLSKLQWLRLIKCTSLKTLPDTVGNLTKLVRLWLRHCTSLTHLPTSIGLLPKLEELEIDVSIDCEKFLSIMGEAWTNLRCLKLNNCGGLEAFVDYSALKKLQYLTIGYSKVTKISSSICSLTRLRSLSIGQCDNLKRLPKNLDAFSRLCGLYIENCPIKKLPSSIGLLSQLEDLILKECKNLQKLPISIQQLKNLERFELNECGNIEAMDALKTLQGLLIWGSTSITKLPITSMGLISSLIVVEGNCDGFHNENYIARRQVLTEDQYGCLEVYQDKRNGKTWLRREDKIQRGLKRRLNFAKGPWRPYIREQV